MRGHRGLSYNFVFSERSQLTKIAFDKNDSILIKKFDLIKKLLKFIFLSFAFYAVKMIMMISV